MNDMQEKCPDGITSGRALSFIYILIVNHT